MSMQQQAEIESLKKRVAELEARIAEIQKWIGERRQIITRPTK